MTNEPIKKIKSGQIEISVWENDIVKDDKPKKFRTATVQKSYTDENGDWKKTNSFTKQDLLVLRTLVDKACEYMLLDINQESVKEEKEPTQEKL